MTMGLWGRKVGMTQVFNEDRVIPVTVIESNNWIITGLKTKENDGYEAVQVGCLKNRFIDQDFSSDWLKHLKKHFTLVKEISLKDGQSLESFSIGTPFASLDVLIEGEIVDVWGRTKGCGFAGVVRRHGFTGGRASHGSKMGKRPGSVGSYRSQGRVIKGKRLPGHMGNKNRVMKNLEVIKVEKDTGVVLVKGSIPGKSGSFVFLRKV